MGPDDPPKPFDFDEYLDFLERTNHNFIRLWAWDTTTFDTRVSPQWTEQTGIIHIAPKPWLRTGPGTALDGKPKFNLEEFDPNYFKRMRDRVQAAQRRGIYVSVMLFEGWTLRDGTRPSAAEENWSLRSHPFHRDNNVQGIGDADGLGTTPEVHSLQHEAVNRVQAAYIRKVIDTVNEFDNVLYEAINEGGEKEWNWWVVQTVQDYERTKPKQHPVGNTGHGVEGLASLLDSPADWVSPGKRDGYGENPPAWNESKVSLFDTDHIWGIGGSADWAWKSFAGGHNPIFMDTYQHVLLGKGRMDQWDDVRMALGATRQLAERVELAAMAPLPALASTKYCLANPGEEYVIYQPLSESFSVNLSAGVYSIEWFQPTSRTANSRDTIRTSGGAEKLTPPFAGPAILLLQATKP